MLFVYNLVYNILYHFLNFPKVKSINVTIYTLKNALTKNLTGSNFSKTNWDIYYEVSLKRDHTIGDLN